MKIDFFFVSFAFYQLQYVKHTLEIIHIVIEKHTN